MLPIIFLIINRMTKNVKREDAEKEWEDKEELNGERDDLNIHVKCVTDEENGLVLFAEAGSDFVDALLTFLRLPLGTVVKFVKPLYYTKVIGSLTTLYNGLENLDSIHFLNKDAKSMLLSPKGLVSKYDWPRYESGFTESTASFTIRDDLWVMGGVEGSVMSTLDSLGYDLIEMEGAKIKDVTFGLTEVKSVLMFLF